MRFEIDLEGVEGALYAYCVQIEVDEYQGLQRVGCEWLHYNGKPLFSADRGEAQLYQDDHRDGSSFSMDWSLSGVGFLMISRDNTLLSGFKDRMARFNFIQLLPSAMADESRHEIYRPDVRLGNFADWYSCQVPYDQISRKIYPPLLARERVHQVIQERINGAQTA